jgi:hypothetical protein
MRILPDLKMFTKPYLALKAKINSIQWVLMA